MKTKNNLKYLDNEEKELIESYSKVDIKSLKKPALKQQKKYKEAAQKFKNKETKMNIRIDPYELKKIKEFADREGLKYQTFIKSVIHKYMTGRLVEKK